MKLKLLAVGTRMPEWVDAAVADFSRRMPREFPFELQEIRPEPRTTGKPVAALMAAEAQRLRAALPAGARKVILDERGDAVTTLQLADRLDRWAMGGSDVAFLIGGPDGLDPDLKADADETLRLSSLTLPHGLARVLLSEALYRAVSLRKGHPYHRE